MTAESNMKRIFIIALALLTLVLNANAKIHTIGDSSMADYDQSEPDQKGMYGWRQVFCDYFKYVDTIKQMFIDDDDTENGTYKQYANRVNADMYLYPIPQSQIEVRKGLYTQNKGY